MNKKILEYLYCRYTLDNTDSSFVESCLTHRPVDLGYNPEDASRLLDRVFDELLEQSADNGLYVIPISGGWDSRIIAGAVRERLDAREIKMVTFGVPGQLDYDLGRLVAKKLGVEHFAIDLSRVELTWEDLRLSVNDAPWTYVPDAFYNRYSLARTGMAGVNVLSGFLGDPLTCFHFSKLTEPDKILRAFTSQQNLSKTCDLHPADFDPLALIPPCGSSTRLHLHDILDFSIRQPNCIAPIVTPMKRWKAWGMYMGKTETCGMHVFAPFAHPAWAAYWLCAPSTMKIEQELYLRMLKHKFPDLARLPSKNSCGLPSSSVFRRRLLARKHAVHRRLNRKFPSLVARPKAFFNYIDFAEAFRKRTDCRVLLDTAFEYLKVKESVPWLNLEAIRTEHMTYAHNHEYALRALVGLALNLSVEFEQGK